MKGRWPNRTYRASAAMATGNVARCMAQLHLEPGWTKVSCVPCLGDICKLEEPPALPRGTQGWTPELFVNRAIKDGFDGITMLEADGTRIISSDAYKLSLDPADAINILGEGMLFTDVECTGAPPASEESAPGRTERRYANGYKL